jgi:penicillin-binding protein 2
MGNWSSQGDKTARQRVLILLAVTALIFVVYLVRLFSMQVVDGYIYRLRAEETRRRTTIIPAQRGQIYDRNFDVPIATNRSSFAVELTPAEIPPERREEVINRLAETLEIPVASIEQELAESSRQSFQSVEVYSGANFDTITYIAEHSQDFPGVFWKSKPIRYYPFGDSMSTLLGYVGEITSEELQLLFNKGYTRDAVLGKAGVELQYDSLLRGQDGRQVRTVDARGRRIGEEYEEIIPPTLGHDAILTIDRHIQELARKALGERIGTVLVTRPSTGEVLAMVSYPSFNPNQFYGKGGANAFREVSLAPNSPFLNRAVQSAYPPASTFKIVMTTAVIEEQVFGLEETVLADGYYQLGNRTFSDWRTSGFGPLTIFGGLANSSNVFFWTMGVEYLGIDRIVEYSRLMGLGSRTGIDLPGEVAGLVPSPEWKERVVGEPWVGGDTANTSIGQGFMKVTPLQLSNVVSFIVNEGVVYRPHVLKEIRDPISGEVVQSQQPEVLFQHALRNSTFENVQRAMRGVITEGTAEVVITTDAVASAGKTGTGEVGSDEQWHSWFVAYAPFETDIPDERVVVTVLVDAENEWEWWAPKAANIILHGIFTGYDYERTVEDLRRGPKPAWYL